MKLLVDSEIKIRPLSLKDAPALADAVNDHFDYMVEWMWFPFLIEDQEDAVKYINEVNTGCYSQSEGEYAVVYKDTFAGIVKVMYSPDAPKIPILGAWLVENYQGRGIMVRTLGKVIEHLFEHTDAEKIMVQVAVGNTRSRKLPEKLGFDFSHVEYNGFGNKPNPLVDLMTYFKCRPEENTSLTLSEKLEFQNF